MGVFVPEELRTLYREGRLVPFVGAGVSMSVEWIDGGKPKRGLSWGEMVDEAIRQLGFAPVELARFRATDLQILEYFGICNGGMTRLTNWLFKEMSAAPDTALESSPIHRALAKLTRCRVCYTTNYDDYLERSLDLLGRKSTVIVTEMQMGRTFDGTTEVVKFHGDFNHPDQMVYSEKDYERRLKLSSALDQRLKADVLGRAILFLGYSFRDPNVAYLFRTVNDELKLMPASGSGRRAFITVQDPSDMEIKLFNARNIEVIPIGERTRVEDTAALLTEIAS